MRAVTRVLAFCLTVLFLGPVVAHAQTTTLQPYVNVGVMNTHVQAGDDEPPYLVGTLGGRAIGAAISAGAGAAHGRLAFEGELSFAREVSALQRNRVQAFRSHQRDVLVSGLMRGRFGRGHRVAVEPIGGVTFAFGRTRYSEAFSLDSLGRPRGAIAIETARRTHLGATGGLDLMVTASRMLQLGVLTRLTLLTGREDRPDGPPEFGLGKTLFRVGAVAKIVAP